MIGREAIRREVTAYYGAKVRRYGASPHGVDWESGPMQELRFLQLLRVFEPAAMPFSLIDLGCGYGAFLSFLDSRAPGACNAFTGVDWSPGMITRARRLHRDRSRASFRLALPERARADYCVASGIFNVKLDFTLAQWEEHVARTLAAMDAACTRGFAFNMMADWPGPASSPQLYRSAPERWAGVCGGTDREVEVRRRYGMREFTLLVHKPAPAPLA